MTSLRPSIALILLLTGLVTGGCADSHPQSGLATTKMRIGNRQFTLEIADTDAARQRGLMKRDFMPDSHGMIFVFDDEAPRSFWMKNTRIPLDILYLSAEGRVVSIKSMQPYNLDSVPSDAPAQFAIELNAGAAARAGVKVGDVLEIPPAARPGDR